MYRCFGYKNIQSEHTLGLSITANRLFGPQPRTATYVCIWTIDIGDVMGLTSAADGRIALWALKSFLHNYVDPYNAPAKEYAVVEDRDGAHFHIFTFFTLTEKIASHLCQGHSKGRRLCMVSRACMHALFCTRWHQT